MLCFHPRGGRITTFTLGVFEPSFDVSVDGGFLGHREPPPFPRVGKTIPGLPIATAATAGGSPRRLRLEPAHWPSATRALSALCVRWVEAAQVELGRSWSPFRAAARASRPSRPRLVAADLETHEKQLRFPGSAPLNPKIGLGPESVIKLSPAPLSRSPEIAGSELLLQQQGHEGKCDPASAL